MHADRQPDVERLALLDGLRGWAALSVVLYHVFANMFVVDDFVRDHLARVPLFNGRMAVQLFFVLSGFALSIGYFQRRGWRGVARLAVGRYVRLTLPILAACSVMAALLAVGWIPAALDRPHWSNFLEFDPSVASLLRFSFFDVYFAYSHERSYLPPLWTMQYELAGSMIVFAMLLLVGRFRWRAVVYAGALIILPNADLRLFVIGLMIADAWSLGWLRLLQQPLVALALLVAGCAMSFAFGVIPYSNHIGAVSLFLAAMLSPWAHARLAGPVSRTLGILSFPLYLTHVAVLSSVGIAWMTPVYGQVLPTILVGIILCVLSLAAAFAFAPVNEAASIAARALGRFIVPDATPLQSSAPHEREDQGRSHARQPFWARGPRQQPPEQV